MPAREIAASCSDCAALACEQTESAAHFLDLQLDPEAFGLTKTDHCFVIGYAESAMAAESSAFPVERSRKSLYFIEIWRV
jgi:hypothetical protein